MAINRYRGAQYLLRALDDVPVQHAREEERLAQEADISAYYQVGILGISSMLDEYDNDQQAEFIGSVIEACDFPLMPDLVPSL